MACGRRLCKCVLIFQQKKVTGFYLGEWLQSRGTIGVIRAGNRVQRMVIEGQIETHVQQRVNLEGVVEGLRQYVDNMTEGKLVILPHMRKRT